MYTTVIFDMDGTLLNTLNDIADSVNAVLKNNGYPEKSLEEVRNAVGNGARRLLEQTLPEGIEADSFERILTEYTEYYQAHCQIKTGPYEGITELLEKLDEKNIKMAIVSNKGDGAVKALNRKYFGKLIANAVGESAGIKRKPEPDLVLEALRILNSTVSESLYVGDSEVDYQTAKNAGMACMLVSWGFRDREDLQKLKAEFLIDRPEELSGYIED